MLAWIDPPEGTRGAEAALRAELERDADGQLLCPPAGPATDPAFDNKLLAPAIERYDRARLRLWARRLQVDAAAGDLAGVRGDLATLEWIRDRFAHTLGLVALTRLDARLVELRAEVGDGNLSGAAAVAATLADAE